MMSGMKMRAMSPVLVGRRDELGQLIDALDVAAAGRSCATLVAGEAGVGKTRLLGEFATIAVDRGFRVVSGRCIDFGELSWPMAPLREIVGQLVDELDSETLANVLGGISGVLAVLVPELDESSAMTQSPASEPLSSDRFCELVVGLFRRLAVAGPVVVVFEDLHWADTSTRRLFSALARVPRLGPVALVGTFRSDELHRRHPLLAPLSQIERSADCQRIDLGQFDRETTAELITSIGARVDPEKVDDIQRRSGGNPFVIEELVAAHRSGIITTPHTLRDAILARAVAFGHAESDLLGVIAVAGRAHVSVLGEVCDLAPAGLGASLDVLVASGLLTVDGDEMRFRHELGREVFADELLPGERARIHGALATCLERRHPKRHGEIARHWAAAHEAPRALVASVHAGREAFQHGAAAEAEGHFSMALELWDAVDQASTICGFDRPALLCEAAVAAEHARHQDRSIELALDAIKELAGQPAREGAVWLELRRIYRLNNRWDDCAKAAAMALELIPESPPSRERAEALAASAMSAAYSGQTIRARDYAVAAVNVADEVGEPEALVDAYYALTMVMSDMGEHEQALAVAMANLARCDHTVNAHRTMMAHNGVTSCLSGLARYDEMIGFAQRGVTIARATGLAGVLGAWMASYWIGALVKLGRWTEAERLVSDLADLLDNPAEEGVLARFWGCALTRQGRLDEARPYIATVRAVLDRKTWLEELQWLGAVVVEFDQADDHPSTTALVDDLLSRPSGAVGGAVELVLAGITALADRLQDDAQSSRGQRQKESVATAERWIEHLDAVADNGRRACPETKLFVEASDAQLTRLSGHAEPDRWAHLAASAEHLGYRYEEATARFHHGEALLAGVAGRALASRRAADRELASARTIAVDLAAAPLIQRIDELAHRARCHLDTFGSQDNPDPARPWQAEFALTPREHDVLALLALGRSNGQIGKELFISTKTASVHVSNILRKLGVKNRVEAAAFAIQRAPATSI